MKYLHNAMIAVDVVDGLKLLKKCVSIFPNGKDKLATPLKGYLDYFEFY